MTTQRPTGLYYDSAADAARAAGVAVSTVTAAIDDGKVPGAYRSSDGWWRVPVDGMRAAGWQVTGEGAHAVGPYDRMLPDPDEHGRWHLGGHYTLHLADVYGDGLRGVIRGKHGGIAAVPVRDLAVIGTAMLAAHQAALRAEGGQA